ncbi:MAG: lysine--tRNA ligase [Myxococcales bacterium]|nr:MAG: lysine--tRNA ligase [Myxococcales bacterium]
MKETSELFQARLAKLEQLRQKGVNPYANDFNVTHTTDDVKRHHGQKTREELEGCKDAYVIAGRIMAIRSFGKAAFVALQDRAGRLQALIQKDAVGEASYELFKLLDVGDIVGVAGTPMRTRTDELTIAATALRLLTKNIRPLPEKWHGLTDMETRYRQRYADLIVNPDVVKVFRTRSRIVRLIRDYLDRRDFMEVETPMLQPIAGGALARPFVTHHNALDMDLYLRIAPELYLKRLLVGGLERVYEINRNFRNEGISVRHNPEFTMLEFYWAYATYQDLITLSEEMIGGIVKEVCGSYQVSYQGQVLDFTPPWERLTPAQAVVKAGIPESDLQGKAALLATAKRLGVENTEAMGEGKLLMEIFDKAAEEKLIQPTFLVDFPLEVSPLARKKESDPTLTDRFEIIVAGREIGNAFSELNDPLDQEQRFQDQLKAREAGDQEAHGMDEDYLRALQYGMPPAAGEGIGIDRLAMLLTDSDSIRDVILFPQLRKEQ